MHALYAPPSFLHVFDHSRSKNLDNECRPLSLFGPWLTVHPTSPSKSLVCCFFFSHHLLPVLQQRSVEDAQFNTQFLDTLLHDLPQCECEAQMNLCANYPSCVHPPFLSSLPLSLQQFYRTGPCAFYLRSVAFLVLFAVRSTLRINLHA